MNKKNNNNDSNKTNKCINNNNIGFQKKIKKSFDVRNPPDVDGDPVDVSVASLGSILWRNFFFAHALFVFSLFPIQ